MSAERETERVETGIRAPPGWLCRSWAGLGGRRLFLFRRCSALGLRRSRSDAFLLTDHPPHHSSPPTETDARPAGPKDTPSPGPSAWPDQSGRTLCSPDFRGILVSLCYHGLPHVVPWRWFREKEVEAGPWLELGGRWDGVSSVTLCHVPNTCLFSSF